jgi:hypothetical protein
MLQPSVSSTGSAVVFHPVAPAATIIPVVVAVASPVTASPAFIVASIIAIPAPMMGTAFVTIPIVTRAVMARTIIGSLISRTRLVIVTIADAACQ